MKEEYETERERGERERVRERGERESERGGVDNKTNSESMGEIIGDRWETGEREGENKKGDKEKSNERQRGDERLKV